MDYRLSFDILILSGLLLFIASIPFLKINIYFYLYLAIFYYFVIIYTSKKLIEAEYNKKKYLAIIATLAVIIFSFAFFSFLYNLNLNHFTETYKSLSHLILLTMFYGYILITTITLAIIISNVLKTHKK
ncbi:MAG: hypothetical protein QXP34_01870 [Candidatus Aenigmatarchaeota archaeon]